MVSETYLRHPPLVYSKGSAMSLCNALPSRRHHCPLRASLSWENWSQEEHSVHPAIPVFCLWRLCCRTGHSGVCIIRDTCLQWHHGVCGC